MRWITHGSDSLEGLLRSALHRLVPDGPCFILQANKSSDPASPYWLGANIYMLPQMGRLRRRKILEKDSRLRRLRIFNFTEECQTDSLLQPIRAGCSV